MIQAIFWDLDECILYTDVNDTDVNDPGQEHISFTLDESPLQYFTIIRPCALELIKFSRNLVGHNNVYILTTSTENYANKINELAGFGFASDHIFHRETIQKAWYSAAYGGGSTAPCNVASKENVLIDNLPSKENYSKMNLIGINRDRYLKVDDYYGCNYPEDPFEDDVKKFLTTKHNDNS